MLLDRMPYPSLDKIRYVNTCKHSHTEMTEDSELEHRFTHTTTHANARITYLSAAPITTDAHHIEAAPCGGTIKPLTRPHYSCLIKSSQASQLTKLR